MFRGPPRLIYIRWLGALCSGVPLGLLIGLLIVLRSLTLETFLWSTSHFLPLIFFGYFLDIVYNRIPKISKVRYPIVKIGAGWLISYPVSQVIGDLAYYILSRDPSYIVLYVQYPSGMLISLILLALVYAFFFYAVYMITLRWYLVRKLKPYLPPRQPQKRL